MYKTIHISNRSSHSGMLYVRPNGRRTGKVRHWSLQSTSAWCAYHVGFQALTTEFTGLADKRSKGLKWVKRQSKRTQLESHGPSQLRCNDLLGIALVCLREQLGDEFSDLPFFVLVFLFCFFGNDCVVTFEEMIRHKQ